jgi:hypothetical protein
MRERDTDRRIILRWIFRNWDVGVWTGLSRLGIGGGHLWMRKWTFGFHKMWGISGLASNRLASQEGLCCIERESEWVSNTHLRQQQQQTPTQHTAMPATQDNDVQCRQHDFIKCLSTAGRGVGNWSTAEKYPMRSAAATGRWTLTIAQQFACFYARSINCKKNWHYWLRHVCPSIWELTAPNGRIFMKFDIWVYF